MEHLLKIQKIDFSNTEITSPACLKFLHNNKGKAVFLNSTHSINTLALIEFIDNGNVRGNHYHINKREVLFIFEGKLKLYSWVPFTKEIKETILEGGDLITIEPNLGHAYKAIKRTIGFEIGICTDTSNDTVYDCKIQ